MRGTVGTIGDPRQADSALDGIRSICLRCAAEGGTMAKTKEIRLDVEAAKHKRLADLARREGASIAVMVRRAINILLDEQAAKEAK
jgi:hypothetical protein